MSGTSTASSAWCKHEGPRVLLVEGTSDCHVVLALCKAHSVPETFGIYACMSDKKVLQRLNALIAAAEQPAAIGVLLDVDHRTVADRWKQVLSKLQHYRYAMPATPSSDGTIIAEMEDLPRLGFWFLPDNQRAGMLEDFLSEFAIPTAFNYAGQCVEEAEKLGHSRFKKAHRAKAVIHTYLAWQDEPGRPLGQAISAGILNPNTPLAQAFTAWLTKLFAD